MAVRFIIIRMMRGNNNQYITKCMLTAWDAGLRELTKGKNVIDEDVQGNYYLHVPGIAINDNFQVLDEYGSYNNRIFMMAVPYIGGYNPDYSGLDFSEEASARIVDAMLALSDEVKD